MCMHAQQWYKCVLSSQAEKMRDVKGGSKKTRRKLFEHREGHDGPEGCWCGWAIKRKDQDIFHAITTYLGISAKVKISIVQPKIR